jgi:hypothetical protein
MVARSMEDLLAVEDDAEGVDRGAAGAIKKNRSCFREYFTASYLILQGVRKPIMVVVWKLS